MIDLEYVHEARGSYSHIRWKGAERTLCNERDMGSAPWPLGSEGKTLCGWCHGHMASIKANQESTQIATGDKQCNQD